MRFVVYPLVAAAIYSVMVGLAVQDFVEQRRKRKQHYQPIDF